MSKLRPAKVSRLEAAELRGEIALLRGRLAEAEADRDHAVRMLMALVKREGRVRFTKDELERVAGYPGLDFTPGVLGITVSLAEPTAAEDAH